MSEPDTIICRPTKWFLWRAVAMVVLFGFFAAWFFRDWKVGYPKKNLVYYTHAAFEEAKKEFKNGETRGQSATEWEVFAKAQKIDFPDEEGVLPAGTDLDQGWPEELLDYEGYKEVYEEKKDTNAPPFWLTYSRSKGWPSKAPKEAMDQDKVGKQLYYSIGAAVLTALALFYMMRTGRRSMMVDEEAYYAPGGPRIPFGKIRRIDKRKWETKGLAYLTFEDEGGGEGKAKVDGMVYGQFREEDGAPAEALFQKILKNFDGELVELAPVEDEEEDSVGEEDGKE